MRYKIAVALLLVAHPGQAASCHRYSRWYYPYPQTCHGNKFTAEFRFVNKFKFKNVVQPASIEPAPSPKLEWTQFKDFPSIEIPQTVVCTDNMSLAQRGICLLKIELEKRHEGATDQR